MEFFFEECDTCKSKPGSPILCEGCLKNRRAISLYSGFVRKYKLEWLFKRYVHEHVDKQK